MHKTILRGKGARCIALYQACYSLLGVAMHGHFIASCRTFHHHHHHHHHHFIRAKNTVTNSELDSRAGQHGSKKAKIHIKLYQAIDKTIELTLDITKI